MVVHKPLSLSFLSKPHLKSLYIISHILMHQSCVWLKMSSGSALLTSYDSRINIHCWKFPGDLGIRILGFYCLWLTFSSWLGTWDPPPQAACCGQKQTIKNNPRGGLKHPPSDSWISCHHSVITKVFESCTAAHTLSPLWLGCTGRTQTRESGFLESNRLRFIAVV